MDIAELPFNRLIGLANEPKTSDELMSLETGPQHENHLGSIHACALLAVAEAGSGEYLLRMLGDVSKYVPVVRRIEAKFRKPATGKIVAKGKVSPETIALWKSELDSRGRLLAAVPVEVVTADGMVVLSAEVEWFIARRP
jgi:acyl-coenzyme A thioesterase PaaI-like protein